MAEKEDRFGPMEEAHKQEQEFFGREMLASREQFAKRDPLLDRLTYAENPRDIQAAVDVMKHFESFDKQEISRYRLENYISAALIGAEVFRKNANDLKAEQVVEGEIGPDGYLVNDGKLKRAGYTIRIDSAKEPRLVPVPKEKRYYKQDEQGNIVFDEKGNPVYEKIERWVDVIPQEVERPYFGTDQERKTLARAYEAGADMLLIRERIHTLYKAFSDYKAELDGMVTLFYTRLPWLSNEQLQKIFTMPDISKMTPENLASLENGKFGTAANDTMRLLYLAGNCETKGKIEAVLNTPGFKDKLLPTLLERMKALRATEQQAGHGVLTKTGLPENPTDIQIVNFLFGDVANWVSDDKRTKETVDVEKERRGYLTEFGNIYTERSFSDENENTILARIELILGNPDAVRVGNRLFKIFGLADELGLEFYKGEGNLPTVAEIEQASKLPYVKWREMADQWLKRFSIQGEPVASDLSKLMHTKYYRLKDILRDRPSGPMFTLDQFERLTLSLLSLNSSKVDVFGVGADNDNYKLWPVRSLMEQWWGYEEDGVLPKEPAKDLGEIDWLVVKMPEEARRIEGEVRKEAEEEAIKKAAEAGEEISVNREATRDEAWGYYVLLLFLSGQDNPLKRPWAFLNFEDYNPHDFLKNNFYTSKSKFLQITGHQGTVGPLTGKKSYRDLYREHGNIERDPTTVPSGIKDPIRVHLKALYETTLRNRTRTYWSGVKTLPQYENEWRTLKLDMVGAAQSLMNRAEFLAKRYGFQD